MFLNLFKLNATCIYVCCLFVIFSFWGLGNNCKWKREISYQQSHWNDEMIAKYVARLVVIYLCVCLFVCLCVCFWV